DFVVRRRIAARRSRWRGEFRQAQIDSRFAHLSVRAEEQYLCRVCVGVSRGWRDRWSRARWRPENRSVIVIAVGERSAEVSNDTDERRTEQRTDAIRSHQPRAIL